MNPGGHPRRRPRRAHAREVVDIEEIRDLGIVIAQRAPSASFKMPRLTASEICPGKSSAVTRRF